MCPRAYISKLGPVSQEILVHVQSQPGYIEMFKMIYEVSKRTGKSHSSKWYFRQLVGLHIEGRIDANITRKGDKLVIRFRRFQENGLEELSDLEEEKELTENQWQFHQRGR